MIPTPEMIEAACNAAKAELYPSELAMRAALTAALALLPGEPVGYTSQENIDALRKNPTWRGAMWAKPLGEGFDTSIPVYAAPAPLPVAVKALEWEAPTLSTNHCWIAKSPFGTYSVVNEDGWYAAREPGDYWEWNGDRIIDTRDSAFRACEADYETRIRSALSSPVGGVEEDVDKCPVCAEPFKADDICATDIELGTCHAACLEGSPTVDLETGEQIDGPIPTYPYGDVYPTPASDIAALREENERIEAERAEQWRLRREAEGDRDLEKSIALSLKMENERLKEALWPFAKVAEKDIGETEHEADLFVPAHAHNRAPRLVVGDFRRAFAALQHVAKGERG